MSKMNGKSKPTGLIESFHAFARTTATAMGSPWSFIVAILIIVGWAIMGPMFHYSNTWQLVVNTGTTIITFLAVFLIQNTQNRDARAVHLKLDELLRSGEKARNHLIDLEHLSDEELDELERQFRICRKKHAPVPEPPTVARATPTGRSQN
jgi:low affinity Fe/Cu permease